MSYVIQATETIRHGDGEYEYTTALCFQYVLPTDTHMVLRSIGLKNVDIKSWDKKLTNDMLPILQAILVYMSQQKPKFVGLDMFNYPHNDQVWTQLQDTLIEFMGACSLWKSVEIQVIF